MSPRRRLRGEEGASLLLALAFLTLFSVVAVSVLGLGSVSFRNTEVTRSRVNQLYAADGGVEYGIQQLSDPNLCQAASSEETPIGTATYNGKQVDVTCQTTDGGTSSTGGSPLLPGYVAVIGTGGVVQTGDGWGTSQIHGDLYSGGPITPGLGAFEVPREISIVGDLDLVDGDPPPPCPPPDVTATSCTVLPTPPSVALPSVVIPTTAAPAPVDLRPEADCTILYPGRYASPPTFDPSLSYYLASGTYYFAGSGDVTLDGTVFGGAPSGSEPWNDAQKVTGASSCASYAGFTDDQLAGVVADFLGFGDSYDPAKAGTGVTLVRGGTGEFRVENDASKIELYTRVPGTGPGSYDAGATPGVTFWANTSTDGALGGSYTPVPADTDVFVTDARDAEVVLHGLSYLAGSYANLREPFNEETTSPGQVSFFLGGVVAKKLAIVRLFDFTFPPISLAGTGEATIIHEPRTTILTATALSTDGGADTEVTAVVKPDEPGGPQVVSWRQG